MEENNRAGLLQHDSCELLPPSGPGRAARPPRPVFLQTKKAFKHDNTFAPSGLFSVGPSPRTTRRKQHLSDYDLDEYDHKYTINKSSPATSNGPHIKAVHSYIFSDKKEYINDCTKSYLDRDEFDDHDYGFSKGYSDGIGSTRGPSAYESKVSTRSTVYQSHIPPISRTPLDITTSSIRRNSPVPSSPNLLRRPPVPASQSLIRRSPSPIRSQVSPSPLLYRRSPSPVSPSSVNRRSPSPVSSSLSLTRRTSPSPVPPSTTLIRRVSPSPVKRSFVSLASTSPTPVRRTSVVSSSSSPVRSHHYPTSAPFRRHSVATSPSLPPASRIPHPVSTTTGTFHAPVYSRRFPDRYALVKSALRPVYSDDFYTEESTIAPFIPRYLGRRHSLDSGLARMGVDSLGTMDVYRKHAVTTTRPPRPRPMHPAITRPVPVLSKEKTSPLFDVDLYYITRQQLLEQPDITSKFQPLKNRLRQIGAEPLHHEAPKMFASPVSRPGEIPHFTSDYIPYEPMYGCPKVRPGGPLYIHSVGEDPRILDHSELEPYKKDGVVCVMVR